MVNLTKALNTLYGVYVLKRHKTDVNLLNLHKFVSFRTVCMPIQEIKKKIQVEHTKCTKTARL